MTAITETFDEVHVRSNVFYLKAADHKVYVDTAMTVQAKTADVLNAYKKNMLVLNNAGALCSAVKMADNSVYTVEVSGSTVSAAAWACAAE